MRDRTRALEMTELTAATLLANVLGSAIYPWGARHAWAIREEAANGIHAVTGEPFAWASFVLPVWIVFLLTNLVWAVTIVVRKLWLQGHLRLASSFIWIIAVTIDFAHH